MVARFEMTRIFGTYWNFYGFWRGRFSTLSGPAAPATVSDLINRTYTLSLQYNNPSSPLVAGGGRLYLPWATSLDMMDGGYVGRRVGEHVTLGVFGGTTPDPTSYDYNPNGKLAGTFINFSGGSWETTRYSTTFGLALSAIDWHANRQFFFSETSIAFANKFSIYDAMEVDADSRRRNGPDDDASDHRQHRRTESQLLHGSLSGQPPSRAQRDRYLFPRFSDFRSATYRYGFARPLPLSGIERWRACELTEGISSIFRYRQKLAQRRYQEFLEPVVRRDFQ